MARTVDYYLAPQSPWTYLGHERFLRIAREAGAMVRMLPVDLPKVFSVSGGLPLHQRPPQRRAYRLLELERWSRHLGMPLNVQPKFFPVSGDAAARLLIAVDEHDGTDAALRLAGAALQAVWAGERNLASDATLGELLQQCGLPSQRLEQATQPAVQRRYEQYTQAAIDAGVFGAPSYVVDGELFWGQDRLDFVQRKLSSAN